MASGRLTRLRREGHVGVACYLAKQLCRAVKLCIYIIRGEGEVSA